MDPGIEGKLRGLGAQRRRPAGDREGLHDKSKFSRAEWKPYVDRFYRGADNKKEFYKALMHHYENNPHHWNFWIDPYTDRPHPIPNYFINEMVADWLGAGRVKEGHWDIVEWYCKNKNKMKLHPATRTVVESLIPYYNEYWDKHYKTNGIAIAKD